MKPQPSLVRTDCTVHLYPETPVDLDISLVVEPGNPENYSALGFRDSLKYLCMFVFWILFDEGNQ